MRELISAPKHADLIYDIGMHKGEDSEFYLRKGFRVIGFEADPDLVDFCKKRLVKYITSKKLVLVEGAILPPEEIEAGKKEILFYKNDNNSLWGTVDLKWAERNVELGTSFRPVKVGVVNFEEILREHGIPHFMKIDIEGCDMVCLNALKHFNQRPDYISMESDKTSLAKIEGEINSLMELGYDRFKAVDQTTLRVTQTAPNPPTEGKYTVQTFEHGSSGLFGSELPGEWKVKKAILREYRVILLGYFLMGDKGIMRNWKFRGAWRLQQLMRKLFHSCYEDYWSWFDTHARLSSDIEQGTAEAGHSPVEPVAEGAGDPGVDKEPEEKPYLSILPEDGWRPLNLRELWQYRDLLFTLAVRDLKLRYKQTLLGVIWVILGPLLAAGVFSFVFGVVAKLPSGKVPYIVFSYAGLLGWNLFSGVLTRITGSLILNSHLIAKVFFPRLILPLATIGSVLVDFSVAAAMMAVLMAVFHVVPSPLLALLPIWMLVLTAIALGGGLVAAALAVSYRDVQYIMPVFTQILLYASPVAYSVAAVPARYRWIYQLNPLTPPLEAMRASLLGNPLPDWRALALSSALGGLLLLAGLYSFKRMERKFADVI